MDIVEVKKKYTPALMRKKNVVGVGVGGDSKVTVFVEKKVPEDQLSSCDIVPRTLDGVETDVVETGKIEAWGYVPRASGVYTGSYDPAPGGVSIGHRDITAGTLGCLVTNAEEQFILSNNHVMACSNDAHIGDDILQPGSYDGGGRVLAWLTNFAKIEFTEGAITCAVTNSLVNWLNRIAVWLKSEHRLYGYRRMSTLNYIDAALACPIDEVSPEILEIGVPKGAAKPILGLDVQKTGRTTGHTVGKIKHVEATVRVSYGLTKTAIFDGQVIAGPMSAGGDSGSAVLDMDGYVVGLLFAGSDKVTIFSPIQKVLDTFQVDIVT